MKSKLMYAIAGMLLMTTIAATHAVYEVKANTAEVEQIKGMYVFCDSKPVREYEYLGSVRNGIGVSSQYTSVRNRLLNNARKEYPEANGIIIHLNSEGFDRADCIKFK